MVYNVQAGLVLSGKTTTELAGFRRGIIWPRNALARFQSVCKAYTTGTLLTKRKKNTRDNTERKKRKLQTFPRNTHPHKAHEFAIADRLVGFVDGGRAVS